MMKFFILLCLALVVLANEEEAVANQDIAKAKQALDQLSFSKEEHLYNIHVNEEEVPQEGGFENEVENPCLNFPCLLGRECVVDEVNNEPFCDCARSCPLPDESDEEIQRVHVCTTTNVTYPNRCEFHRQKCLDAALDDVQIDYHEQCTVIPECSEEALAEYPERMTQWIIESLKFLTGKKEEHGGLTKKEKDVLKEQRNPEAQAIFWKFRRLDKNPADLYLDFAELEPLRGPISVIEPCTQPFLALCDSDENSLISAIEFARCLNIPERHWEY